MRKEIKNIEEYVNVKYSESENLGIEFIDFSVETGVEHFTKNITLGDDEFSEIEEKLVETIKSNSIYSIPCKHIPKDEEFDEDSNLRKLLSKCMQASMRIATEGKIGKATHVMCSEKNQKKIEGFIELEKLTVLNAEVDDFYLYRKNETNESSVICCYNDDKYCIISVGLFPDRQFAKVEML